MTKCQQKVTEACASLGLTSRLFKVMLKRVIGLLGMLVVHYFEILASSSTECSRGF